MKKQINRLPLEYIPLIALILLNLGIGAFTLLSYGESWDEYSFYIHGAQSLSAYARLITAPGQPVIFDPTHRFYGPAYAMLAAFVIQRMPHLLASDVAHALNFLTFQVGLIFFYLLARRWLKPFAAWGATLLFSTQPLLWGHAFINPKDTIFMTGFLANIYMGLKMVDAYPKLASLPIKSTTLNPLIAQDWASLDRNIKRRLVVFTGLILFLALILTGAIFWLRGTYFPPVYYDPHTEIFERYLYKVLTQVEQTGLFFILFLFGSSWAFLPHLPNFREKLVREELAPFGSQIKQAFKTKELIIAGVILGITASLRFLALAVVGGILGLYLLLKHGRTTLPFLVTYFSIAILIMFVTWPYLWGAPLLRFLLTTVVMLHFPFPGKILFNGQFYLPDSLPRTYLPQLITFQLTEPVLLLALIGFLILAFTNWSQWKHTKRWCLANPLTDLFYWVFFWFVLPVTGAVLIRAYMYDNFRQFHFILPPLFFLAGLALDFFVQKVKSLPIQIALLGIIVFPGVLGIARLAPYEYTYYNSLIKQPFRKYELDYWGTSFREAAGYLNANVPEGGMVKVWGPVHTLWPYIRSDIQVFKEDETLPEGTFYALILTRDNKDLEIYPEYVPVFKVERNGAVFSIIKRIP